MSWLVWLLPIGAGVADAAKRGVIKLTKVHTFTLLGGGFLFALPYEIAWLFLERPEQVDPSFWFVMLLQVPLLVIAMILTVEAHRTSPLLLTAPYLALTPAFLLVTSLSWEVECQRCSGGLVF